MQTQTLTLCMNMGVTPTQKKWDGIMKLVLFLTMLLSLMVSCSKKVDQPTQEPPPAQQTGGTEILKGVQTGEISITVGDEMPSIEGKKIGDIHLLILNGYIEIWALKGKEWSFVDRFKLGDQSLDTLDLHLYQVDDIDMELQPQENGIYIENTTAKVYHYFNGEFKFLGKINIYDLIKKQSSSGNSHYCDLNRIIVVETIDELYTITNVLRHAIAYVSELGAVYIFDGRRWIQANIDIYGVGNKKPSSNEGDVGQYFIDIQNLIIYYKKDDNSWCRVVRFRILPFGSHTDNDNSDQDSNPPVMDELPTPTSTSTKARLFAIANNDRVLGLARSFHLPLRERTFPLLANDETNSETLEHAGEFQAITDMPGKRVLKYNTDAQVAFAFDLSAVDFERLKSFKLKFRAFKHFGKDDEHDKQTEMLCSLNLGKCFGKMFPQNSPEFDDVNPHFYKDNWWYWFIHTFEPKTIGGLNKHGDNVILKGSGNGLLEFFGYYFGNNGSYQYGFMDVKIVERTIPLMELLGKDNFRRAFDFNPRFKQFWKGSTRGRYMVFVLTDDMAFAKDDLPFVDIEYY